MGIKVIIDMMINHTSSKHPWFIEASSNKNSKYRNYYIWATPNTNLDEPSDLGTRQWYKRVIVTTMLYFGLKCQTSILTIKL